MNKAQHLALGAALLLLPSAGSATEIFGGIYKHNVDTPLSLGEGLEGGADFQLGVRGNGIGGTRIQPHVFGALNSKGDTSYAAIGVSRKYGRKYYVRPGLGLAIHDGADDKFNRSDRIAFGSRILFELEASVGAQVSERVSIEASWVHLSHATLFSGQNPGIDNMGARVNVRL